jgi:hypothetical protein
MQLHVARLCLDCQEVHSDTRCPVCASESFAALSRWIPLQERRVRPRSTAGPDVVETYRRLLDATATVEEPSRNRMKWPRRAAVIVATLGVGSWLWRRSPGSGKSTESPE